MSFLGRILGFGGTGPYGEDRFSMLRKSPAFRSKPQDEDRLQGEGNRAFLRQQCLDLYRTSAIARAAVARIADYSTVCQPYPRTDSDAWNREAAEYFDWWSDNCDYRQRPGTDLCALTRIVHISDHIVGESFWQLVDNGQVMPIESDRIATPREFLRDPLVFDGIRTNGAGRITHYYVCPRGSYGNVDPTKWQRVRAENMIQVVEPWRVDQLHGVPRIHAAVQKIADYTETDEAMRNKVKNEARSFYKSGDTTQFGGSRSRTGGAEGGKYEIVKTELGAIWKGDIEVVESKSPNASYTTHMMEEAKAVAAAVDIPYEYLMQIFTAGSYNAQKGARLAFSDTCTRRALMAQKRFLQRLWNWSIARAVNERRIGPAPTHRGYDGIRRSQWNRCGWGLPKFKDIDLGRDVSAKSAAWAAGQQSLRDGREDPYSVLTAKAEDILKADEIAQKLNAKLTTGKVSWQHIINAGVPGLTVEPVTGDDEEESDVSKTE